MKKVLLIVSMLIASPAFAQQPQPTVQEQLYTVCGNTNTQLAKMIDAANAQIADLKKQLDAAIAKGKQEEKK